MLVKERQYINQGFSQVTISFQLSSHDWNLLKSSDEWMKAEQLIQEIQNKGGDFNAKNNTVPE